MSTRDKFEFLLELRHNHKRDEIVRLIEMKMEII